MLQHQEMMMLQHPEMTAGHCRDECELNGNVSSNGDDEPTQAEKDQAELSM